MQNSTLILIKKKTLHFSDDIELNIKVKSLQQATHIKEAIEELGKLLKLLNKKKTDKLNLLILYIRNWKSSLYAIVGDGR